MKYILTEKSVLFCHQEPMQMVRSKDSALLFERSKSISNIVELLQGECKLAEPYQLQCFGSESEPHRQTLQSNFRILTPTLQSANRNLLRRLDSSGIPKPKSIVLQQRQRKFIEHAAIGDVPRIACAHLVLSPEHIEHVMQVILDIPMGTQCLIN